MTSIHESKNQPFSIDQLNAELKHLTTLTDIPPGQDMSGFVSLLANDAIHIGTKKIETAIVGRLPVFGDLVHSALYYAPTLAYRDSFIAEQYITEPLLSGRKQSIVDAVPETAFAAVAPILVDIINPALTVYVNANKFATRAENHSGIVEAEADVIKAQQKGMLPDKVRKFLESVQLQTGMIQSGNHDVANAHKNVKKILEARLIDPNHLPLIEKILFFGEPDFVKSSEYKQLLQQMNWLLAHNKADEAQQALQKTTDEYAARKNWRTKMPLIADYRTIALKTARNNSTSSSGRTILR